VLWDVNGVTLGVVGTITFLAWLRLQGDERIARRLKARPLSMAQAPLLHAMVNEYCRRLSLPLPAIQVIESPALNFAVFGFAFAQMNLAVTRGALEKLSREELSALVGRELTCLWHGETVNESWLAQLLSCIDRLISPPRARGSLHGRRFYPLKLFIRQILIYPLTLFPAWVLRARSDPSTVDLRSIKVTKKPEALAEGLRLLEANHQRLVFYSRFSVRHLFLITPPAQDPLARVFFESEGLFSRIASVEKLTEVVALS